MKRYLAFYGDRFYPLGGAEDFIGDFDSIQEATDSIFESKNKNNRREESDWGYDWCHIYDAVTRTIVYEKNIDS